MPSPPAICPYGMYRSVQGLIVARPLTAIVVTNSLTLLFVWIRHARAHGGIKKALTSLLMKAVKSIPGAAGAVAQEQQSIIKKMEKSVIGDASKWGLRHAELPREGIPISTLVPKMREWATAETAKWCNGQVSGGIYHGGEELSNLISDVFRLFIVSNPLHVDVFPAVRKMDAEVVSMVANMFGGGETCGTMTSGGTESILMAMYSAREWARTEKGIHAPEMIVPKTAHAAFNKAAHYFGITLVQCEVDKNTYLCDIRDVQKKINRNTIILVGSAPTFPHGVIDPIEDLAKLAKKHNLWLHVDCCLGSFVAACARAAGFPTRPFDFTVDGVSSLSCDTHKYGFAPKGSSVILYKNKKLRSFQFFTAPKWVGGIYATPALQGSRAGALTAACWAVMSHIGLQGYIDSSRRILTVAKGIESAIRQIKELRICGNPDLMVVSFVSADKSVPIHALGDAMSHRGWNLNTLQDPAAIHIAVTLMHCRPEMPKKFIDDLIAAVEEVKAKGPGAYKDGMGAIYGMAESVPAEMVGELTSAFLDCVYKV